MSEKFNQNQFETHKKSSEEQEPNLKEVETGAEKTNDEIEKEKEKEAEKIALEKLEILRQLW